MNGTSKGDRENSALLDAEVMVDPNIEPTLEPIAGPMDTLPQSPPTQTGQEHGSTA